MRQADRDHLSSRMIIPLKGDFLDDGRFACPSGFYGGELLGTVGHMVNLNSYAKLLCHKRAMPL